MSFIRTEVEKRWYSKPGILLGLTPLSHLFGVLATFRKARLTAAQKPLPIPVVVVGNISVGGTGKTPLIITLVSYLKQKGWKPGVISRGYGRSNPYQNSVHCIGVNSTSEEAGDEPILIYQKTGCAVAVADDRVDAAQRLIHNFHCDVILSDDGMQHYKLPRDMEIAVVDGQRMFGNEKLLPVGPLREPIERLNDVDCIVVNGKSNKLNIGNLVKKAINVSVKPVSLVNIKTDEVLPLKDIGDAQDPIAISGLGDPTKFFGTLNSLGLKFERKAYEDHHQYSIDDLLQIAGRDVIMTSKDAVKVREILCKNPENETLNNTGFWYLDVTMNVSAEFLEAFHNSVSNIKRQKKK